MLPSYWAFVASAILLYGAVAYARSIWHGQTRPNLVTWVLWSIAPAIALAAQFSGGAGLEALLTFSIAFGPLIVIGTSLARRHAQWRPSRFDYVCGGASIMALVLWRITGDGMVALLFSIVADLLAALPTVLKSYQYPQTESAGTFWAGVIATIINLLTLSHFTFISASVSVYVLIINLVLAILISFPRLGRGQT